MVKIYVLLEDYSGYESPFYAQHGISFLIEHGGKSILFDVGQEAKPILHNMRRLGLEPNNIDYIFLSHCHYDHTGGLLEMLKAIGKRIPIIAHPMIFRKHFVIKPCLMDVGVPFEREEIEQYAELFLTNEPIQILEGVYSTGEVREREDFEKTNLEVYTLKDGKLIRDELLDDMSLVIRTSEGLVIISGCSHAGIVSIVKHAIKITGEKRIRSVIGGFHLIDASDERIIKTVEKLKKLDVEEVYTGHCTGLKAEAEFLTDYGEKFHKIHSGMIIEF
ncbi:MBL fold metallo-hydrolase [Methanotorris formicicus]|uniref:Metal-dependent hydrolase/oxidoreductase, beta-lactamase family n=1 Tax=Methanotorris formicicus Mc-S-70 TaxID=647171 RepID=H1L0U6_9EURY|nr:MBL fold metallo-hydrolase [Methanotorris formicicus]EHP84393.1 metal-dependent hydrolase/oxidoreductase, beta-lactamase family [Methanotorris formicicus Mc-S-70]